MSPGQGSRVGEVVELTLGSVAHGGHVVGRVDELVVFVRHGLPGERVRARVTRGKEGDRFLLADAIEVLDASPHRVSPPCPAAGPGGCGGCDFQHAALDYQRQLKAEVIAEQLSRLAGVDRSVRVEAVPGDRQGLRWRTRVELAVDRGGRTGLRRHHSRAIVPLNDCLIAREEIAAAGVFGRRYPGSVSVHAVVSSEGERAVVAAPRGLRATPTIHERVTVGEGALEFRLNALSFWQVHPGAAAALVEAVRRGLSPRAGERVLDLYAGVGLFARALADDVGPSGEVVAVETDARACAAARTGAGGQPMVQVRRGTVSSYVDDLVAEGQTRDLVVLDPPRAGAGQAVMEAVLALRPRAVAYVACDPASLARDVGIAARCGYRLGELTAYDAFPMTHHVECVAILRPDAEAVDPDPSSREARRPGPLAGD